MPAKKNQSMRSKSTTSYKKGGSIKNQKMHPLKYFNDQREKRIVEAQKGREIYGKYEDKMPPMDSTTRANLIKASKTASEKIKEPWGSVRSKTKDSKLGKYTGGRKAVYMAKKKSKKK